MLDHAIMLKIALVDHKYSGSGVMHFYIPLQGVPKKRGISEDSSVCFTAQLMLNLGFSFSIHLKIEIHMFVPSTQAFLSDIREPRN